jgi:hypothetical protein
LGRAGPNCVALIYTAGTPWSSAVSVFSIKGGGPIGGGRDSGYRLAEHRRSRQRDRSARRTWAGRRAAVRAGGPRACCDVVLPLHHRSRVRIWLTDSDRHASPMTQCDFEKGSLLCGQRGLTRFAIATQQHVGKRVSILLGSRSVPLGTLAILRGASAVLEGIRVVAAVDE